MNFHFVKFLSRKKHPPTSHGDMGVNISKGCMVSGFHFSQAGMDWKTSEYVTSPCRSVWKSRGPNAACTVTIACSVGTPKRSLKAGQSQRQRPFRQAEAGRRHGFSNRVNICDALSAVASVVQTSQAYPAKLAMAANDWALRLAPPTSAPSISGCAINPFTLSGLTLPP